MSLTCRFYPSNFPHMDEVVMVKVRSIVAEVGVYVQLMEYNNIEGMIPMGEVTKTRIRSIQKLVQIGSHQSYVVIRVDEEKGYIDLSKRRTQEEDTVGCVERFTRGKTVSSILHRVAELLQYKTNDQLEALFAKTAWHFDKKYNRDGAGYDAFKKAVSDPTVLDECGLDDNTKQVLLDNIVHRFRAQAVKLRADVEVCCYTYDGIEAVKKALRAGLGCSTEEMPIKISLIASPVYQLTTTTLDQEEGLVVLNKAMNQIRGTIERSKGYFKVQRIPQLALTEESAGSTLDQCNEEEEQLSDDEDPPKDNDSY